MGHPIEDPECRGGAVFEHVAVALLKTAGNLVYPGVDGGEGRSCGIVDTEPGDCPNLVGEPAPGLRHKPESGLLGRYRTLEGVAFAVHLPAHGAPAVRELVGARSGVVRKVEGRTFEVVAHNLGHVEHRNRFAGLDVEGHLVAGVVARSEVEIFVGIEILPSEEVEGRPDPRLASPEAAEIGRAVGVAEAEILIFAREESRLAGE